MQLSLVKRGDAKKLSPYPSAFSRDLRRYIRERDNHLCQICGASPGLKELPVHHIDYNKDNVEPSNLVTLCEPCHGKTNYNREYWETLLREFMAGRSDLISAA
jgi:5-methylcytosine-specific restriction endonuclease McrA